jgi:hypothetical protein
VNRHGSRTAVVRPRRSVGRWCTAATLTIAAVIAAGASVAHAQAGGLFDVFAENIR